MFEMSLVLWYEGEALALGVDFCACVSDLFNIVGVFKETLLYFPAIFSVIWFGSLDSF